MVFVLLGIRIATVLTVKNADNSFIYHKISLRLQGEVWKKIYYLHFICIFFPSIPMKSHSSYTFVMRQSELHKDAGSPRLRRHQPQPWHNRTAHSVGGRWPARQRSGWSGFGWVGLDWDWLRHFPLKHTNLPSCSCRNSGNFYFWITSPKDATMWENDFFEGLFVAAKREYMQNENLSRDKGLLRAIWKSFGEAGIASSSSQDV